MSWQELGHSTWGRFSRHRSFHYRKRFAYPERVLLNSKRLDPQRRKPQVCISLFRIKHMLQRSPPPPWPSSPLPHNTPSVSIAVPRSKLSHFFKEFFYLAVCVLDCHRRECEWEQWYGGWGPACCQLFWWLQIASALVGWSRHQQAEELSKELP